MSVQFFRTLRWLEIQSFLHCQLTVQHLIVPPLAIQDSTLRRSYQKICRIEFYRSLLGGQTNKSNQSNQIWKVKIWTQTVHLSQFPTKPILAHWLRMMERTNARLLHPQLVSIQSS